MSDIEDEFDEFNDYRQPTFEEAQRVSIIGRELDPRNKRDSVLLEIRRILIENYDMDPINDMQSINSLLETIDEYEHLNYYNARYLASATVYMQRYRFTTKKTLKEFIERYDLQCAAMIRYIRIVTSLK